jgi:hypothetical protein
MRFPKNEPQRIYEELTSMPEWERIGEVRQFSLSLRIFEGNADELIGFLERLKAEPVALALWRPENRLRLDEAREEIARLLHNFVAGAFSLVDHARRFYDRNYKTDGRFSGYDEAVKARFADDPLCQFVQGLRNYFVHKKIPTLSTTLSFKEGEDLDTSSFLQKEELLDFDWNATARSYLDGAPARMDLLTIASAYRTKVAEFYEWVFSRLEAIHAADHAVVEAKREELRQAVNAREERWAGLARRPRGKI